MRIIKSNEIEFEKAKHTAISFGCDCHTLQVLDIDSLMVL